MRIKFVLTLVLSAFLFVGCSLMQRRSLPVNNEVTPVQTDPEPQVTKLPTFKKLIKDQDLKQNQENSELKKRVVILPFIDMRGIHDSVVLKKSYDAFIDALNQSNELIALDSSAIKIDLNKYKTDKTYNLKAIAKDSQNAGVSSILEGRIIDLRFKNEALENINNSSRENVQNVAFDVVVQVRMLNIHSEQELFNTVKTITIEDESSKVPVSLGSDNFFKSNSALTELLIKDAFLDFIPKLVESLKYIIWEGRIAALQGEKIYLNVGQISGVQVGDILKVVDDGHEVYDTELGYHIGKVSGRVKGTLEVVGFFGQDGAISVIHSGAGFKENDRIELYQ